MTESCTDVIDAALDAIAELPAGDTMTIEALREFLHAPPRVLVAGRANSGKSTLVNALIGAPVAEIGAVETTASVTLYIHGAPARTENFGDRTVHRLPSAALRELEVIDSPGLSTLTTQYDDAARRALSAGAALDTHADIVVLLLDSEIRADEDELVRGWSFSPLTAYGALARADLFGWGPFGDSDPLIAARERATNMSHDLRTKLSAVHPISGLLGLASHTGGVTGRHARRLYEMREADRWDLADRFDSPTASEGDRELLEAVGEYTIVHGRTAAHSGPALHDWMTDRSGVAHLRDEVLCAARRLGPLRRGAVVLDQLAGLAQGHSARQEIREQVHAASSHPGMRLVHMHSDYQQLYRDDPDSPLLALMATMLTCDTPAEQLGLPAHASDTQVRAAASKVLADVAEHSMVGVTGAEEAALTDIAMHVRRLVPEPAP